MSLLFTFLLETTFLSSQHADIHTSNKKMLSNSESLGNVSLEAVNWERYFLAYLWIWL